jgi:hypothetical protein
LAGISIAHLYNLRKSKTYSGQRHQYEKTKPVYSKIATCTISLSSLLRHPGKWKRTLIYPLICCVVNRDSA